MLQTGIIGKFVLGVTAGLLLSVSVAAAGSIQTRTKEGLGTYLVDEKGMTLYKFKKDTPDKSACGAENGCIEKWPLFYIGNDGILVGVDVAELGALPREDGKPQSTYKGAPLYYYFKDKAPGDTFGQGLNNVWFVVAP